MTKRMLAGALLAVGLAVPAVFVAAPAQAAISNCPSGATCLWEDKDYATNGNGASLVSFQRYIPDLGLWQYSGTTISANDSVSSVYNNGNMSTVYLYRDVNKGGWVISFLIKTGDSDLSNNGSGINDNISSGYFAGY